ncbi:hypothetical protein [Chryseobacterium oryctis]|uniref:Peptidase S74 domain-containing protein n=1 Tax=Chryseobacterium oryctis TaxID=2952618 RepID=A0ABT3HL63_9FLAO|nr:hypothetical protein [Chryseobacterium oryctis]MCW3160522.1 hypothetical protein [Chryseobacterium oryctis]
MKTKEELKLYFENGDKPTQEHFWQWQDSYWHKNEKIPSNKLDYDFSQKADANASNINPQNAQLWKEKIETQTSIQNPQLNGNILTIFYTGENGVQQSQNVDLSGLATNNISIQNAEYDASQNIITITQSDGSSFAVNLSEFSIVPATDVDGSVSLVQEGVEKVKIHKVGISGSYNDLSDKPTFSGNDNLQNVIDRGNGTTKPIIFQPGQGRAGEINFSPTTYSFWFGNMNTDHTGAYGLGIGYNTLSKLTTGSNNIALGSYALNEATTGRWNTATGVSSGAKLTTGNFNAFFGTQAGNETTTGNGNTYIGDEAGNKNITGTNNTALGLGAAYSLTNGTQNTFLGAFAGNIHGKATGSGAWGYNTFIGYNAASTTHAMGVWGDNNVVIGCNAPLGGSTFNKLVIESNPVARRHDLVTPLIGGDFAARTLDFDAVVSAKRTPLADNTYTKVAVLNANNVFGYKNLSDFSDFISLTGTGMGAPVTGNIQFTNEDPEERIIYRTNELDGVKSALGLFPESVMMFSGNLDGTNTSSVDVSKENGVFAYGHSSHLMLSDVGAALRQTNGGAVKGIFASPNIDEPVLIEHETTNARGLSSKTYFGDNAQENDYIQKQYADKQHSYTIAEELTGGKWINGKPVYKKTLFLDQIPRTGEIDLRSEFPDLETIISNEMFTEWYALDTAFAGNQWRTKIYITVEREKATIELLGEPDYDYSIINSFTLTLEYTKK